MDAWVFTSHSPQGRGELNALIAEAEPWMNRATEVAAVEASRGGISQSEIRTVSEALETDD